MSIRFLNKQKWYKKLSVAVTAGLLASVYMPGAYAADYTNQSLTGTMNDRGFLDSKTATVSRGSDGTITYNFTGDNSFTINNVLGGAGFAFGSSGSISGSSAMPDKIVVNSDGVIKINSSTPVERSNNCYYVKQT